MSTETTLEIRGLILPKTAQAFLKLPIPITIYIDPDGNTPRDTYGEHSAFNGDFDPNSSLSGYNGMGGSHGMYFASNAGGGGGSATTFGETQAYADIMAAIYFPGISFDTPPDDHFNQFGQFLYTDNKETNNIVIDFQNRITGGLNTAPCIYAVTGFYI